MGAPPPAGACEVLGALVKNRLLGTSLGVMSLVGCEPHPIDLLPLADQRASASATSPDSQPIERSSMGGAGGSVSGALAADDVLVLLVVDDVPIDTDDAIEARLLSMGLAVNRVPEAMVTPAFAQQHHLVVVSPSADSDGIGGSLRDIAAPMLLLEPSIAAAQGLGTLTASDGDSEVAIEHATHPIAANTSGSVPLCDGAVALPGNEILGTGQNVASASLNPNVSIIFAYERGALAPDELPARRVGFGVLRLAACQTEATWGYFDSSVAWLLSV